MHVIEERLRITFYGPYRLVALSHHHSRVDKLLEKNKLLLNIGGSNAGWRYSSIPSKWEVLFPYSLGVVLRLVWIGTCTYQQTESA